MRRSLLWVLCLPFCLLAGCGPASPPAAASIPEEAGSREARTDVIVFAAASMQETLDEIRAMYAEAAPEVRLTCSFDSSGTLKTQIEEGAPCDVFISAAQKQMNQLDGGGDGEDGLHMIDPSTRINLLENKVTLVVPPGNPAGITGFDDLVQRLRDGGILVAVGNSDVPVGQYTQRIFSYYGLDEAQLADSGELTYSTNVKEVTTQVAAGSVDCGIIYATDAFSAGLEVAGEATAEMCGQVIYPAAVLSESPHKEAAEAFLDYLRGPEAMAVFESAGFSPVSS